MENNAFEKSALNTVKRLPKRGFYDKETIYGILDQHYLCHLSWEDQGQPSKIRTGPPGDDDADYDLPIWAGVLPVSLAYHHPIPDPAMNHELPEPQSIFSRRVKEK